MQAQTQLSWHEYQAELTRSKASKPAKTLLWKCDLHQTFIGEYLLLPITSLRKLHKEEQVLNNNCSSNLFRCYNETYSAISLRTRSGERIATICLQKEQNYWELDSCLGRNSENVLEETLIYMDEDLNVQEETTPTDLYYICQEAVRLMNNRQNSH